MSRGRRLAVAVLATALVLAGCSSTGPQASTGPDATNRPGPTASGDELSGPLSIYAAASLTGTFTSLAKAFAREHPGVDVRPVSFDGSSTLATQIAEGAPADVFASADRATMAELGDAVAAPKVFATNTLMLAVAPGNPRGISSLADLEDRGLTVVLCAPKVPCGAASHRLLDEAGVTVRPASEEQNVKAVLTKVALGQADAGLVYKTDVIAAADRVDGIDVDAGAVVNTYVIARVAASDHTAIADAFIDFVLSGTGQEILGQAGFGKP